MKDDIRYSEFLFLAALERCEPGFQYVSVNYPEQQRAIGLSQTYYLEMIMTLAEDGHIGFDEQFLQRLVGRLRREANGPVPEAIGIKPHEWSNPREALHDRMLRGLGHRLRVTYRGLRRIEELREQLKHDRILEPLGVLLDIRYFPRDLENALKRSPDVPVSILRLDMDDFKKINEKFGHRAGDIVMKGYLEAVRNAVGSFGDAYRGRGDEVVVLMLGQDHNRNVEISERMRLSIEQMKLESEGAILPQVTASIGVATAPPDIRTEALERLADTRQLQAKREGKNRVISS